ncbi:alpha/beta hydrolase [uncultured Trichococcus sp.]|uniref:alpha/beta fold hydrolase n=1 Tax=uncultured Trichococcus sp. TaxID=189665 RepID=UPI0029C8481E|nr:alpha/beta hydrolase [uncultured Trichococcus sp.]
MRGKTLRTGKGKLYYQVGGKGDALLLLHGNGESSDIFAKQFPFFTKHFTVYALDTRGHGRSDLGVQRLTFKQIAADILALLEKEQIQRIHVLGFSDGGNLGLYLAAHHPERISSLVAMGANYEADGLTDACNEETLERYKELLALPDSDPEKIQRLCIHNLMLEELDLSAEDLRRIQTPTLLVAGEFDLIRDDQTEAMHRLIPGSRKCIVPGGSHSFFVDDPKVLERLSKKFYSSL